LIALLVRIDQSRQSALAKPLFTGLPTRVLLGNSGGMKRAGAVRDPALSARDIFFSETYVTDVASGPERRRNDATMAAMPPTSMNPPNTNGSATTPINGFNNKMRPEIITNMLKIPALHPPP